MASNVRAPRWAVGFYRRLHEGLPARSASKIEVRQPVKIGRARIGCIEQIQYFKKTTRGTEVFWHPFERHAQPELWRDGRGKLFVWGCAYKVTDRGIEDLYTRVCQNLRPETLITLGTLDWIRYRDDRGRSGILKFEGSASPDLLLDERGKLHLLGGRYSAEVNPMARRRRHRRHHAMRLNPSGHGSLMGSAKKLGLAFLATGAGVFVGWQALSFVGSKLPVMNPYLKAAAKAAIGVAAGIAAYKLVPGKLAPTVGTALGAGGVFVGVSDAWSQYRASASAAGVFSLPPGRRAGVVGNAYAVAGRRAA